MLESSQRHDAPLGSVIEADFSRRVARPHDENAVRDRQHLGQVSRYHQNGEAIAGKLSHERIDLGLGSNIHAARRFIDNEYARLRGKPLRKHHLLLVAAAQQADQLLDRRRLDLKPPYIAFDHLGFFARPDEARARNAPKPQRREGPPRATLTSLPTERKNMTSALANGQLDVVIDVAQPISGSVRHQPLFEDEFRIVTRRDHPLGRRLALPGYMKAEHVAVSTRAKGAVVKDIALLNLGLQRRIGVRCQNYHAACRLVAQSDYMLTMPARLARHIDAQQSLKHWALPFSLPLSICICTGTRTVRQIQQTFGFASSLSVSIFSHFPVAYHSDLPRNPQPALRRLQRPFL